MQPPKLLLPLVLIIASVAACSETLKPVAEGPEGKTPKTELQSRPVSKLARADRATLQRQATAACECDAANGKNCWSEYRTAIEPFRPVDENGDRPASAATACAPISTMIDCLADADGEFCITTGYNVVGVDIEDGRLCKRAEAEALDHAFNAAFAKPGGNHAAAQRAAKEALVAVRAGRAPKAPSTSGGCV